MGGKKLVYNHSRSRIENLNTVFKIPIYDSVLSNAKS